MSAITQGKIAVALKDGRIGEVDYIKRNRKIVLVFKDGARKAYFPGALREATAQERKEYTNA